MNIACEHMSFLTEKFHQTGERSNSMNSRSCWGNKKEVRLDSSELLGKINNLSKMTEVRVHPTQIPSTQLSVVDDRFLVDGFAERPADSPQLPNALAFPPPSSSTLRGESAGWGFEGSLSRRGGRDGRSIMFCC